MRVLGIDPGYAIVGWGVVEYISNRFAPIGYGAVITEKDTPFEQRLVEIYESVFDICKRYQPEALSIEKLYYQHNQTTVIGVAEARGVILLAAAQCGVPIYEYTPMQVKQAITGYGLPALLAKLDEVLNHRVRTIEIVLPYDKLALADILRSRGSVAAEEYREDGVYYRGTVKIDDLHRFEEFLV